ncbi:hypothetical protein ACOME3_004888 [Neoechinorhynchus agilis]
MYCDQIIEGKLVLCPWDIDELTKILLEAPQETSKIVIFVKEIVREATKKFHIKKFPTVVSMCCGRETARFTGMKPRPYYERFLNEYFRKSNVCAPHNVIEITVMSMITNLMDDLSSKKPLLVVDFYSDWCQFCSMMSVVLEDLSIERQDVMFCKLNVDLPLGSLMAKKLGIFSLPTIDLITNRSLMPKGKNLRILRFPGKEVPYVRVASRTGYQTKAELSSCIDEAIEQIRNRSKIGRLVCNVMRSFERLSVWLSHK